MVPVTVTDKQLVKQSRSDLLAAVPESSVWLANFTSDATRNTYRLAIGEFVAAMQIRNESEWVKIRPSHAIA